MDELTDMSIPDLNKRLYALQEKQNEVSRVLCLRGKESLPETFTRTLLVKTSLVREINNTWYGRDKLKLPELKSELKEVECVLNDLRERQHQLEQACEKYGENDED